MPLHISEIGVRLSVGDASGLSGTGRSTGGGAATEQTPNPQALAPQSMNELVERCVQQVLDRLKRMESR
ncbi:hypothetical protein EI613_17200 [Azospirillum sp. 412522]|nr:DUF5908 family protein [Azospirillum sp. 412522]MBY6263637.1 hypothetical protein [Azospirillum sp. 412522]